MKRTDNAIFRRAISAIKPKVIEIKLRPERRVLLDSSAAEKVGEMDLEEHAVGISPEALVNLRASVPLIPKFNPALDLKLDIDEKKKSVRERLGDKIEPDLPSVRTLDKVDDTKDKEKSRDKKDVSKKDKDKRSSPAKEKVQIERQLAIAFISTFVCLFFSLISFSPFSLFPLS